MWSTPVPLAVFLQQQQEAAISVYTQTQVAKVSNLADAECSIRVSVANTSNAL